MQISKKLINPGNISEFQSKYQQIDIPEVSKASVERINIPDLADLFSPDPFGLKNLDHKLTLLYVGITGDLYPRFFASSFEILLQGIPNLKENLEVIGVGRRSQTEGDQVIKTLQSKHPSIPLTKYMNVDYCKQALSNAELKVDGIFLALPPSDHLKETKEFLEASSGAPIFCEKPLCLPNEIEEFDNFVKDNPNKVIPIDMFVTTAPFYWLLNDPKGADILKSFGKPVIINGTVCEQQEVEINRLGGNLGLLREEISGGGILYDAAVHVYTFAAALMKVLKVPDKENNIKVNSSTYINQEYLDEKLDPDYRNPALFRETAGLLQDIRENLIINIQGLKGCEHNFFNLDTINEDGERLIFGFGTAFKPPYLAYLSKKNKLQLITFDCELADVGYAASIYSMLSFMYNTDPEKMFPNLKTMLESAFNAVRACSLSNTVDYQDFHYYKLGEMPEHSIPLPLEIDELVPARKHASFNA